MADDFKALLEEQKKTTRQLMSVEERAVEDVKERKKSESKSESAQRGWETRQENAIKKQTEEIIKPVDEPIIDQLEENKEKDILATEDANEKQETYFQNLSQFLGKKLDFLKEKGGAAAAETREKGRRLGQKTLTYLESISKGIGGMAKRAKDAIKSKLPSMSTLLMMGVAGAMLALMNSPAMAALKDFLMTKVIPVIADLWEKVLKPAFKATLKYFKEIWPDIKKGMGELVTIAGKFYKDHIHPIVLWLGGKFKNFFDDLKGFLADPSWSSLGTLIGENKVAVGLIVAALAPGLMFGGLLKAVKLIGPAFTGIKAAVGVVGGSVAAATILAYAGIALSAARALAISMGTYAEELKKGKPAIDALGTASREWVAEFLGWPANFAKDAVSWAAGQMGYKVLSKELDKTDMRDVIKKGVDGWVLLFKKSFEGWGKLIKKIMDIDWKGFIRKMMGTGKFGTWITENVFGIGTKEEEAAEDVEKAAAAERAKVAKEKSDKGSRLFQARRELIGIKKDVAEERFWETAANISEDWDRLEAVTKEIKQLESDLNQMRQAVPAVDARSSTVVTDIKSSMTLQQTAMTNPSVVEYMLRAATP